MKKKEVGRQNDWKNKVEAVEKNDERKYQKELVLLPGLSTWNKNRFRNLRNIVDKQNETL